MKNIILLILTGSIFFYSCKKIVFDPADTFADYGDVIICNEGNYKWGNASLSLYKPIRNGKEKLTNKIFKKRNNLSLGDVCQSIYYSGISKQYYVMLNNSGKITVLDRNFTKVKDILGFKGVRYMTSTDKKLYVTDMYSNVITIIDQKKDSIIKKVYLKGWCNELVNIDHKKIAITNVDSKYIYFLDINKDYISDSIEIGKGATYVKRIKNGIAIMRNSYYNKPDTKGELILIENYPKLKIVKRIENDSFKLLATRYDTLLVNAGNSIFKFNYKDNIDFSKPIIVGNWENIYQIGLGNTNEIYVSDAKDYISHGDIYHYSTNGKLKHSFKTGIIPSYFYFR